MCGSRKSWTPGVQSFELRSWHNVMATPSPTLRIVPVQRLYSSEKKRLYRRLHQLIHFSFYKVKKKNMSSKDDTMLQDYTGITSHAMMNIHWSVKSTEAQWSVSLKGLGLGASRGAGSRPAQERCEFTSWALLMCKAPHIITAWSFAYRAAASAWHLSIH